MPEERKSAIRKCIERIAVDKSAGSAVVHIRPLPNPALRGQSAEALTVTLPKAGTAPRRDNAE